MSALVALWDHEYGLWLYDYERVTRRSRDKAVVLRNEFISARCNGDEGVFLGDFNITHGDAELKFEWRPLGGPLLRELLWWAFGSYSPLQFEASRLYGYNPAIYFGEESFGTLKEIISESNALRN